MIKYLHENKEKCMSKTVLITGGSRGIGAATVRVFTDKGYKVAFIYEENDQAAQKVAEETGAIPFKCNVADREAVKNTVKAAKIYLETTAFDVLVCNAGISYDGTFTDMTFEEWDHMRAVNLDGYVNVIKEVLPFMINNHRGSIVTVSSMWGETGASCEVPYSMTKAAVIGLTKSLAKEAGPSGIRVNCVAPGVIDTDMCRIYPEEIIEELAGETPLERIGQPEDVAKAIYFLASEDASFITGQVLGVNGGFYI